MKSFNPIPSEFAIQWSRFLLSMNHRSMAVQALHDLLESYDVDGNVNVSAKQIGEATEVMALQLLLPDEGIETARQFVKGSTLLDDAAKLVRT